MSLFDIQDQLCDSVSFLGIHRLQDSQTILEAKQTILKN